MPQLLSRRQFIQSEPTMLKVEKKSLPGGVEPFAQGPLGLNKRLEGLFALTLLALAFGNDAFSLHFC